MARRATACSRAPYLEAGRRRSAAVVAKGRDAGAASSVSLRYGCATRGARPRAALSTTARACDAIGVSWAAAGCLDATLLPLRFGSRLCTTNSLGGFYQLRQWHAGRCRHMRTTHKLAAPLPRGALKGPAEVSFRTAAPKGQRPRPPRLPGEGHPASQGLHPGRCDTVVLAPGHPQCAHRLVWLPRVQIHRGSPWHPARRSAAEPAFRPSPPGWLGRHT